MLRPKPNLSWILLTIVGLAYPFMVYFGLKVFSPLVIGIAFIAFLTLRVFINHRQKKSRLEMFALGISIFCVLGLLFVDSLLAIKAYPVVLSLSLASVFAYSLFFPPCMIERFARVLEPNLNDRGVSYTRNVTWVWICFFVINSGISAWLALNSTLENWTLYNGFISYILIAIVFGCELFIRQFVKKYHVSEAES